MTRQKSCTCFYYGEKWSLCDYCESFDNNKEMDNGPEEEDDEQANDE